MAKKIVAVARSPLMDKDRIKRDSYRQEEIFPLAKIILRGKDSAFCAAVKQVLNADLPQTPNTTVKINKAATLLWLGPEEYLLWCDNDKRQPYLGDLQKAFAPLHAAAVDVSDYYTVIRLGGAQAKPVLAQGCPLDLRDTALPVGGCAQSHYRQAALLLYRGGDEMYDVQVRWSFADYLWQYFSRVSDA